MLRVFASLWKTAFRLRECVIADTCARHLYGVVWKNACSALFHTTPYIVARLRRASVRRKDRKADTPGELGAYGIYGRLLYDQRLCDGRRAGICSAGALPVLAISSSLPLLPDSA